MTIRTFQPGDETAQMHVYNTDAGQLPKVKLASLAEIQRRTSAGDFDPGTRFYAVDGNETVAYATFQDSGRVSFPWCLPGHEEWREPLLDHVLNAMRGRGIRHAFAAYRGDWPTILDFFEEHDFRCTREMLNFALRWEDLPTTITRVSQVVSKLMPDDVPALLAMAGATSSASAEEKERSWLHNPYFSKDAFFVLRNESTSEAEAVGVFVTDASYANVTELDASMPCFRLGAFGTEGLTWKRINGTFSFVVRDPDRAGTLGLDLLGYTNSILTDDVEALAAQVPSDAEHLVQFYKRHFELQGSFPLYERAL